MFDLKFVLRITGLLMSLVGLMCCDQPAADATITPAPPVQVSVSAPLFASPQPTATLTPSPWQEDLAVLQEMLITARTRTASEIQAIEAAIEALAPRLEVLAEPEALVAIAGLVAQYGGPEVVAELTAHRAFDLHYPVKVTATDRGLYITDTTAPYRRLLGMRLLRIEGTRDSAIIRALETLIHTSDPDLVRALAAELAVRPAILTSLGIVASERDATFVLSGSDGVRYRVSLGGVSSSSIVWGGAVDAPRQIGMLPPAAYYAFEIDAPHSTLILRYARAEELLGLPFDAFLQDLFVSGDALVPVDVVVDLRGNPGGRVDQTEALLAYLRPRVAASWIAQVTAIVDAETMGAAFDCAARLQDEVGASIVSDGAAYLALWRRSQRYMQLPNGGLVLAMGGGSASQAALVDVVIFPDAAGEELREGRDGLLHALLARSEELARGAADAVSPAPDSVDLIPRIPRPTRSDAWRRDLEAIVGLMATLAAEHGGKFEVVHSADYQAMVQSLTSRIPNLEDHKVILGLMQLLAQAQDAHTRIPVDAWPTFSSLQVPVRVKWFGDALYITEVQPGFDALLGSEVVAINTFSPQEILAAVAPLVSHETEAGLMAASERLLVNPFILQALGTTPSLTEVTLGLRALTGVESEVVLPALSEAVLIPTWHSVLDPTATALWQRQPDTTFYWYTLLDSGRVLYFQWNACKEQADLPYEPFLDAMFDAFARAGAQRIVVDLRRNEGGFSQYLAPFLVRLRQTPQLLEPGHLDVLVGHHTFSTASYLAGVLHTQYGARLIGKPMGQVPPFYASIEGLILPSSRLTVHYPTQIWSVGVDQDQGLDLVTVDLTFSDYLLGRDPVLRRALAGP